MQAVVWVLGGEFVTSLGGGCVPCKFCVWDGKLIGKRGDASGDVEGANYPSTPCPH